MKTTGTECMHKQLTKRFVWRGRKSTVSALAAVTKERGVKSFPSRRSSDNAYEGIKICLAVFSSIFFDPQCSTYN